jgi:DNA repair protein RecN (Recombination protein N)
MRAEKVAGDLAEAQEIVGGSASPIPGLMALARRLERKSGDLSGLLDETIVALNAALDQLELVRGGLEAALRSCEFDPHELERTEERLFALRAAGRKYQVAIDDLPARAAEFAARLADLEFGEEKLKAVEQQLAQALELYRNAAQELSRSRADAAAALEKAVNAELPALRLEAARFMVRQETDETLVSPDGFDRIAFHVRTNPGTEPGPLMKIASGGELSRFLLALKVALADRGSAPTLVFDEIDAGAGGAVAEAIGRRLARLAEQVQVLAVTHAPQVAAHAGSHFLIAKESLAKGRRVATRVQPIAGAQRREEIARMLAGATISEEARAAAERLMKGAA